MSDHETTLRAMADDTLWNAEMRAAARAGADALRRGTCGTCKWFQPWFKDGVTPSGYPAHRGDCLHRHYRGRRNGQSPDDGCIKGFAPAEPTR